MVSIDDPFLDILPAIDRPNREGICPDPGQMLWVHSLRDPTRETMLQFAKDTHPYLIQIVSDPRFIPSLWTALAPPNAPGKSPRKKPLFRIKGGGRLEEKNIVPLGSSPDFDIDVSASVNIEGLFQDLIQLVKGVIDFILDEELEIPFTRITPITWEAGTEQVRGVTIDGAFAVRQYRNDTRGDQGIRVFVSIDGHQDAFLDFKMLPTPGILQGYTILDLLAQNFEAIKNRTSIVFGSGGGSGAIGAYRSAIVNLEVLDADALGPALEEERASRRKIGFNQIKIRNHYIRINKLLRFGIEGVSRVPELKELLKAFVVDFLQWLADPRRHQEFSSLEEIRSWAVPRPDSGGHTELLDTLEFFAVDPAVADPIIRSLVEAAQIPIRASADPTLTHESYMLIQKKLTDPESVPKRESPTVPLAPSRSPTAQAFVNALRSRAPTSGSPVPFIEEESTAPVGGMTLLPTATPALSTRGAAGGGF